MSIADLKKSSGIAQPDGDKPSKKLESTYLPRPSDPMDDLIIETTFTGTIVIFMLLTLSYLVYKRKNRFEMLQTELARKRTMRGDGHKSIKDLSASTEVGSLFR